MRPDFDSKLSTFQTLTQKFGAPNKWKTVKKCDLISTPNSRQSKLQCQTLEHQLKKKG